MNKPIAENKKARFDYNITETLEAGIVLLGSEVKSLRLGKASIRESYASQKDGELVFINFNIPVYELAAKGQNHEPKRFRKLLLHKKEKKAYAKKLRQWVLDAHKRWNEGTHVDVQLGYLYEDMI